MKVEAVGVGMKTRDPRARKVEAAMSAVAQKCADEGITDPDTIRARMLEARAGVIDGAH